MFSNYSFIPVGPELDEEREEELEEMLRDEILKYNPEMAEEVDNEIGEEVPYSPDQESQDLALINYLYRNGYADEAPEQLDYEDQGPEPWEDMGPAPEVRYTILSINSVNI